jgi:hypothetical protein
MPLLDARIAALSAKNKTALIQIAHTTALELHFVGLREGFSWTPFVRGMTAAGPHSSS